MKTVTCTKLAELQREAAEKPRRRTNFNLHEQLEDPIQRLCITGEPDTVFPPHRHLGKWELVTVLKGSFTIYLYDDNGTVTAQYDMAPGGEIMAGEIPPDTWHNYIFHESGTTFLEVKRGPYAPLTPEEQAPFSGKTPDKK
ncbi:MAG: WbuC family cupin fold metalloprotein [Lentisphaeria bacterium]|nr:WbuC family cupin fold metalloprotein [Lentisphaeria bacterium]